MFLFFLLFLFFLFMFLDMFFLFIIFDFFVYIFEKFFLVFDYLTGLLLLSEMCISDSSFSDFSFFFSNSDFISFIDCGVFEFNPLEEFFIFLFIFFFLIFCYIFSVLVYKYRFYLVFGFKHWYLEILFSFFFFYFFWCFFNCYDFFCFNLYIINFDLIMLLILFSFNMVKDWGFLVYFVFFKSLGLFFFLLSFLFNILNFSFLIMLQNLGIFPFFFLYFDVLSFFYSSGVLLVYVYPKIVFLLFSLNFPNLCLCIFSFKILIFISLVFSSGFIIFCGINSDFSGLFSGCLYVNSFLFLFSVFFSFYSGFFYLLTSSFLLYCYLKHSKDLYSWVFFGLPFSFMTIHKYFILFLLFKESFLIFLILSFNMSLIVCVYLFLYDESKSIFE